MTSRSRETIPAAFCELCGQMFPKIGDSVFCSHKCEQVHTKRFKTLTKSPDKAQRCPLCGGKYITETCVPCDLKAAMGYRV